MVRVASPPQREWGGRQGRARVSCKRHEQAPWLLFPCDLRSPPHPGCITIAHPPHALFISDCCFNHLSDSADPPSAIMSHVHHGAATASPRAFASYSFASQAMFNGLSDFNQPLNWNVGQVTTMQVRRRRALCSLTLRLATSCDPLSACEGGKRPRGLAGMDGQGLIA